MKFIKPSVELLSDFNMTHDNYSEDSPYVLIEKAGRTCYKSEDLITNDSAKKFYLGLAKSGHHAMLEHAVFVFDVTEVEEEHLVFLNTSFLNITNELLDAVNRRKLISGNLRALNEAKCIPLLKALIEKDPDLVYSDVTREAVSEFENIKSAKIVELCDIEDITEEELYAHGHFSFRFITDRGVTHEMVRHRVASFAQESTRYCNYSKEKHGNELTFVLPSTYDNWNKIAQLSYEASCDFVELMYKKMLETGLKPQEARSILSNTLKTEIIMTANIEEWMHFINLRSLGTTGSPHPDIKVLADPVKDIVYERIESILS